MMTDPCVPTCLRCEEDEFDVVGEIAYDSLHQLAYLASEGVEPDVLVAWCRDQKESIDADDLHEAIAWLVALEQKFQAELQPRRELRRKG